METPMTQQTPWHSEARPPRVATDVRVLTRTKKGLVRCRAQNLSLTGVYVLGVVAPRGREVRLWLELPGEKAPIAVRGRVVRCDTAGRRGVGLTFSAIGWDDMLSIARFLAPRL